MDVNVVAIVPAKDRADSVGATVDALRRLTDRVLVVDDGSRDATAQEARQAGAEVLRLPENVGKGDAVAAGVNAAPEADVYLLIDADLGSTASRANALLDPVVAGDADMTIAVLPGAEGKGGFGTVRAFAARGIRRACGFAAAAPLSGQRAIRAPLLRSLQLAPRFGLETALTIDAVGRGARVVEVPVAMDHRHTGRRLSGFRHRGRQGVDVAWALWPRVRSARRRLAALVVLTATVLAAGVWTGSRWEPSSVPLRERPTKVVLFGMPRLGFDDLGGGLTPNLDRIVADGAVAAMSVRTAAGRPSSVEGYAALGAGVRVRASNLGGLSYNAGTPIAGTPAREAMEALTGRAPAGDIVVLGGPAVRRQAFGLYLSSEPGALGQALHTAGKQTAIVGNADTPGPLIAPEQQIHRPAAIALMDKRSAVDVGAVEAADLLVADETSPFGVRADVEKVVAASRRALETADVLVVDPGDLDRAGAFARLALEPAGQAARVRALARTDAILGRLRAALPQGALLVVAGITPSSSTWTLTPVAAVGPGVPHGYLHSPSTKRLGVVTVTDLAPTILAALGVEPADGMIGHALRYHPGDGDLGTLRRLERDTNYREAVYRPVTRWYVIFQVLLYLVVVFALSRRGGPGRGTALRFFVLAAAAFPLATFLLRAIPGTTAIGFASMPVLVGLTMLIAVVAQRSRAHALSPLAWVMGATLAVIVIDVATGSTLHVSSVLGYSLQSAGRFYGVPNTTFAVLAVCSLLLVAIHVQFSRRRREAVMIGAAVFLVVLTADGLPSLGDDAGGLLALTPAFGLTLVALSGRRISWRTVLLALVATALVLGAVGLVDLLRPPEARTHFGRFIASLGGDDGSGVFTTTFLRKQSANLRILTKSVWTWIIPSAALLMLYLLVWERKWNELVPRRSALRVGLVGAVAVSLVGFVVNDSGPIVIALFYVFICPYLTLLALHGNRDAPVLLPPFPAVRTSAEQQAVATRR